MFHMSVNESTSEESASFDQFVLLDVEAGDSPISSKRASSGVSPTAETGAKTVLAVSELLEHSPGLHQRHTGRNVAQTPISKIMLKDAVELPKYPHVHERFKIAWGNSELFHAILGKYALIETTRAKRAGFPQELIAELSALTHMHDELFGLPPHFLETAYENDPF